jgi:hypothetical protein
LHIQMDGRDAVPFVGQGLSAHVVEQVIRSVEQEGEQIKEKAQSHFNTWVKDYKIDIKEESFCPLTKSTDNQNVSAHWLDCEGRASEVVPCHGRLSDLVVLSRSGDDQDTQAPLIIEAALLETGRPIMVMPPQKSPSCGSNMCIFWNGSLESARALSAATAFLPHAEKITVLAAPNVDSLGDDAAGVCDYLEWYGLKADLVTINCQSTEVGAKLVAHVNEIGADLFVMGAYSHSKIRQLILGSVTQHILTELSVPLLFTH